jgi:molecular chaperone GrpE (heat shock protein)
MASCPGPGWQTAALAKEVAERMNTQVLDFTECLQRADDREKLNLRLEVEKLRRGQDDWLQVLVHMLDHIYALNQGAVRSRQTHVIEQVGNFQRTCRDVVRRVGLVPFSAAEAEPFDPQRHQLMQGQAPEGAVVADTLATGYTFQGRLIRPALVRLREETPQESAQAEPHQVEPQIAEADSAQSQLPLEVAALGTT